MSDPIVQIGNGSIRGLVEKHEDGFNYYAFKGIPYAEPPIGELRFADPVPKREWNGILDCKKYGPKCLQYDMILNDSTDNEDCLYLNVFTKSVSESNKNVPVIMVIHGGGFVFGCSSDLLYGPEYLIRHDVVLVMINYRLGVLGFLNLEHEIAPGNQGFKDQVLALQWIQKNIRMFGGNPDNVTVFGATAAGAAAHSLALSPLTKGLMHKVISQGCVVHNPWVHVKNPRSNAIKLCSFLGKQFTDPKEIFQFLKTLDAKKLLEAQEYLRNNMPGLPFGPGIDDKSSNPFMPIQAQTAASNAIPLPYLVGCNAREGLVFLADNVFLPKIPKKQFFELGNQDFGAMLRYNGKDILDLYNLTEMQIKKMYYKNDIVSDENLDNFVDLTTDIYFVEGIHKFARMQVEKSSTPTYLYRFSYESPHSLTKLILKDMPDGCSHFDDLPFLFKMHAFEKAGLAYFQKGSRSYKLMEQMTEMWTNFAKYGSPTIETSEIVSINWLPLSDGTLLRYLNIDDDIKMESTINLDQKFLSAKQIKA